MNIVLRTMRGSTFLLMAVALAFVLGGIFPAHAQDEKGEGNGTEDYVLEPVKVFANKREQSAQEVPISMTIMDMDKLEDAGIKTLKDVFDRIPNLYTGETVGNNRFMSFRGKTTMGFIEANPLIVYVDGIPMDSFLNTDPSLLNIERIEILRGSQSVMYGKSSMGGVINIISKKPTNEQMITTYGSVGSYFSRELGGLATGPIVEDKVYYSFSAQYDGTNGYMDNNNSNESNKRDTGRVKGQLRMIPNDQLEMNLVADYMTEYKGMEANIKGINPTLESELNPDDRTIGNAFNTAFALNYTTDWSKFESVSTYRQDSVDYTQDMTYLQLAGIKDSGRKVDKWEFSQEFRLKSPEDQDGIRWLTGFYGSHKNHDRKKVYSTIPALNMESHSPNEETANDFAAFGQVVFPFLEDKLELSTALRLQYTEKHIDFKHYTVMNNVIIPGNQESTGDNWAAVLPRLGLSYHFTDDIMAYSSVTRGFQPGGFNWSSTNIDPEKHTFDEQTSWDYEIGAKSMFMDNKLMVNANLFYSDIKDLQTISYDAATLSYLAQNAGKAYSWGGELEVLARPMKGLDLEFSAAFTRAEFEKYTGENAAGAFDYKGNKVPLTPEHTLSAAAQYRFDNGIFIRGEVLNYGKLYWDDANTSSRSDMTITNAKVGYEADSWKAFIYGNNVFDERYLSYYSASSDMGTVGAPTEFGIKAELTF
jgi:iron complex outermembrane receptor protein